MPIGYHNSLMHSGLQSACASWYIDFTSPSRRQCGGQVAQLVEALRYKTEGRWFDSQWCHTSKGGQCVELTTFHLHVPNVFKSGSLSLLETPGPIQVCRGIALPHHEGIQEKQMYSSAQTS